MSAWSNAPLSTLGQIITGSTPSTNEPSFFGGGIPFVTPSELDAEKAVTTASRTLSELGASQARLLPAGAVMVCCIGSLGKVGIAGTPLVTNQQINSVVFDPQKVDARFGLYACRQLKPALEKRAASTTIPIVSKSAFSQIEIPVPSLPEQRRIAAILDQADTLRVKRRAALSHLNKIAQAIFVEMFGNPITNDKQWQLRTLDDVASSIADGPFGSNLKVSDYVENGIPVLQGKNITGNKLNLNNLRFITFGKASEFARSKVYPGDHLIIKIGSIGYSALINSLDAHDYAVIPANMAKISPKKNLISSGYLHAFLTHESIAKRFSELSSKTAQPALSLGKIKSMPLPVPPLEKQKIFEDHISIIERLECSLRTSLSVFEALFASLQHRAFTGAL